jgi:HSP20 family protein
MVSKCRVWEMITDDNNPPKKDDQYDRLKEQRNRRKILHELQHHLKKTFHDISLKELEPGDSYRYGFDVHVGQDGIPYLNEFGDFQQKNVFSLKDLIDFNENQSLFDIMESNEHISVTTEIFGINEKDIFVAVHNFKLIIAVNNKNWQFHKSINLPRTIKPGTVTYTYNNGVLDIIVKK